MKEKFETIGVASVVIIAIASCLTFVCSLLVMIWSDDTDVKHLAVKLICTSFISGVCSAIIASIVSEY